MQGGRREGRRKIVVFTMANTMYKSETDIFTENNTPYVHVVGNERYPLLRE